MPDFPFFAEATPRYTLPMLHAAQAGKELLVNESLALLDAVLHCNIEGEVADPPLAPADGQNWIVAADATGEWDGQTGKLACRQGGNWLFISPRNGLRVHDNGLGQERFFSGSWRKASVLQEPTGGSSVDEQAREAIGQMISALQNLGLLPGS